MYVGRVIQAVSGSAAWVVSFATLVDNIDPKTKGRVLATAMSFVTLGIVAGPMVSGMCFQLLGYWAAWSVPIALLVLDFIARLLMLETRRVTKETTKVARADPEETAGLLQSEPEGYQSIESDQQTSEPKPPSPRGFYRIVLTSPRAIAALVNTVMLSAILAGFDATLPLYLRNTFGWDSLKVGMIFLGLQGPPIFLGPFVGWLRDRVGPRYPTTLGWSLLFPLLWLQATPDHEGFSWARPENHGQAVFLCGLIGIGFAVLLLRGAGTFQLISKLAKPHTILSSTFEDDLTKVITAVTNELQAENPNIFGPYGGNSKISGVTEIAFNCGMMVGPLFSGLLREALGYYYMNCILGKSPSILALLHAHMAIRAALFVCGGLFFCVF